MSLIIKQVENKRDLKAFIDFPLELYKENDYFVPKLEMDEYDTLDPKKNPAYDFCEAALYLAYKDNKLAGRVAAIINHSANEKWNHKEVRFGWIDFIEDREVCQALIDKVSEYGKSKGMNRIVGPLGFTDFDAEGMLIEGFDKLCTMVLIYNYPYYPQYLEEMGFTKVVDWLEYKINIPKEVPPKVKQLARIVSERSGLKVRKLTRKDIKDKNMGQQVFNLVNDTYKDLYNFTVLPDKLIDKYVNHYLSIIDLDYISVVEDKNGDLVGFGFSMPSIVEALRKSKGKLWPFGWFHLLKSLFFKHEERIELLLVGIKPEYANMGALALIFDDLIPRFVKGGFKYAETNAELEYNLKVQAPWEHFDHEQTKRRRVYGKDI